MCVFRTSKEIEILKITNNIHSRTALDNTKRWGTLGIVNQLFKIYFKVSALLLFLDTRTMMHVVLLFLAQQASFVQAANASY